VSPRPETTTDETAAPEASSEASSTGSDPFVGKIGPGFDPTRDNGSGPDPVGFASDEPAGLLLPIPDVSEEQVRSVLGNGGDMLHALVGVGEYDLVMTEADLDRIAPPLTRIVNRYEPVKAVAGHSDEAAVAIGFGMYGWRTALERRAVNRAKADRPVPGEQIHQPAARPAEPFAGDVPDNLHALSVEEGYQPMGIRLGPTPPPEGT
jgi:hypothetical protein